MKPKMTTAENTAQAPLRILLKSWNDRLPMKGSAHSYSLLFFGKD
jgi:hypothetical protein